MNAKRAISFVLCILIIGVTVMFSACSVFGGKYYDDSKNRVVSKLNIGEFDTLTLNYQSDGSYLFENEKVRMILNSNGSIREYANKEVNIYFVKDAYNATPVRLDRREEFAISNYDTVVSEVVENNASNKKIQFTYKFDYITIVTTIALASQSDEAVFNVALYGNRYSDTVVDVEYPIFENIDTLNKQETDYFVAPYATGYLFSDPLKYFNEGKEGIGKTQGLYPSGWYYTMQFASYYSKGLGGFYWMTKDAGDGLKSFSFVGDEGKLRMSVYHYLDDMKDGDTIFNYDTVVANMNDGSWYEAVERYKDWSTTQDYLPDKLEDRTDIDKKLYEDTTLTFFGYRADATSSWKDMVAIYDMIASRIDNNILNLSIYNTKKYYDLVREYGHSYICFEFNSISDDTKYASNKMINVHNIDQAFPVNTIPFYYQCPYNDEWLASRITADENYLAQFNADGFYYDVAFTAVHPLQCYNESHDHGSLTNMLPYFYKQLSNSDKQAQEAGVYSVGVEMITDKVIQYIDFYQARANAGLLGWMESDQIRDLLENGCAVKIPLFDYAFHEYGAVRCDGYLVPIDELGQSYYYIAAYTALNGGIPEFNLEYYADEDIPSAALINIQMVDYINTLGKVRTGFGKDYLVYGQMVRAPEIGTSRTEYEYFNSNIRPWCDTPYIGGTHTLDDVVMSAYKTTDGRIAIFLANVSQNNINTKFVLNALRDYGIANGKVYVTSTNGAKTQIATIKNGSAKIDLSLATGEVYMLEIE